MGDLINPNSRRPWRYKDNPAAHISDLMDENDFMGWIEWMRLQSDIMEELEDEEYGLSYTGMIALYHICCHLADGVPYRSPLHSYRSLFDAPPEDADG